MKEVCFTNLSCKKCLLVLYLSFRQGAGYLRLEIGVLGISDSDTYIELCQSKRKNTGSVLGKLLCFVLVDSFHTKSYKLCGNPVKVETEKTN